MRFNEVTIQIKLNDLITNQNKDSTFQWNGRIQVMNMTLKLNGAFAIEILTSSLNDSKLKQKQLVSKHNFDQRVPNFETIGRLRMLKDSRNARPTVHTYYANGTNESRCMLSRWLIIILRFVNNAALIEPRK